MTPPALRERLRHLARDSITHGLERDEPIAVVLPEWPEALCAERASFVTLRTEAELRGCVGALEPVRPLVQDVAANAFAAAFKDPRFDPVTAVEVPRLDIHLSILSPVEALEAGSEAELLARLRPGVDGLIFEEGERSGTFLPAVWGSLPDAGEFLAQLRAKAGFPPDYWSDQVRAYRYTTEEF